LFERISSPKKAKMCQKSGTALVVQRREACEESQTQAQLCLCAFGKCSRTVAKKRSDIKKNKEEYLLVTTESPIASKNLQEQIFCSHIE
jgi:hypothetical protein